MNKCFVRVRRAAITVFLFCTAIFVSSCGTSSSAVSPNSVTGNWSVTLYNSSNVAAYVYTTTLTQQNGSPTTSSSVTGSKLNLTTANKACFDATESAKQTGLYTVSGNFNGLTATTVQLSVEGNPGNLSMLGTFTTNSVSGSWSLATTGPDTCDKSGTFLMTRS